MKAKTLALALAALLLFGGCATVLKKPDVLTVKRIAIASLYANYEIYDVKSAKSQKEGLNLLKAVVTTQVRKHEQVETDARLQITTYGLKVFFENLDALEQWDLVPPAEVIESAEYKDFFTTDHGSKLKNLIGSVGKKLAMTEWVVPPGMERIPFESVAKTGSRKVVNGKEVHEEARAKVAQLCQALNVDAVAIVQIDLAYKKGMLSGMSGTGLFSGVLGRATPNVSAAMVMINKDGKIVAQTSPIARGGGTRFESDGAAPMLKKGVVYLKDKKGKAVHAYDEAVEKSAVALKEKITKEFAK
jgi:hypothetical protein